MANYDFTTNLSPLDFESLSKDLLEAEMGIQLENFKEGRDGGVDLRYAPGRSVSRIGDSNQAPRKNAPDLIVQCKRHATFSTLKAELKKQEVAKLAVLKPNRYILTTAARLSPKQTDELKDLLSPFVLSTGDIYGRDRLNALLRKHEEVERRHIKLWVGSTGILNSILHAKSHVVSREEVERTINAARLYVKNKSFDEALTILKHQRVCIISGLPGIGKTTLARMLMLYFYDRKFDVVKIESDISEAREVGYHNAARFYYYDDFLGQTASADKLNKNEDQKLLDFIASVRDSKESVLVLTTREYILNQAKFSYEKLANANFDQRTCAIDLSKYSRQIRGQILYNHLFFSKLPRAHIQELVSAKGYLKIVDHKNYNPRLIEHLTDPLWVGEASAKEYLSLFLRTLDNPVRIWDHAFRNQISEEARHLLFILLTLPLEVRLNELDQAYKSFHVAECERVGICHKASDLRKALKELEGTFLSTRKIRDSVLIRFSNPSIRDYMKNVLIEGDLLHEVTSSFVFFEQAEWLVNTLHETGKTTKNDQLRTHLVECIATMKRLVSATSCSFIIEGTEHWSRLITQCANPASRIATVAEIVSRELGSGDDLWVIERLSELSNDLDSDDLCAALCVTGLETLHELGYLKSAAGRRFASAVKHNAIKELSDLDHFDTVGLLTSLIPDEFSESEMSEIQQAFSRVAESWYENCDETHPDDVRETATRIGNIGEALQVDTSDVRRDLKRYADELEREQGSGWEDVEGYGGSGVTDGCSDRDLDGMFATLRD